MPSVSPPEKSCERCGTLFTPRPGKPGRFCSLPCMRGKLDLTGQRFGRLLVLEPADPSSSGKPRWRCACDCGSEFVADQSSLQTGDSRSCHCLRSEKTRERGKARKQAHPRREHPLYHIWLGMMARCHNPKKDNYDLYGGRGIVVCERWQDFDAFAADMGTRPSLEHSLDRIDGSQGYEPGNVRWAAPEVQQSNRSNNYRIEFQGETLTAAQWERKTGLNAQAIKWRLARGWSVESALTTPSRPKKPNGMGRKRP